MIEANHKKIWELFFVLYSKIMLKNIFHDVRVHYSSTTKSNSLQEQNRAILLISNHIFFWDGFLQMLLARKFFHKRIFIMMLEEQLSKRLFLTHGGCFSVKKKSRDIINSLNYAQEKLKDPANMLLIFPQGKIQSLYTTKMKFEKGIEYIIKRNPDCDIWFNINLINFFSRKKPVLNSYLKSYNSNQEIESQKDSICQIENAFNNFAAECRNQESETVKGEPLI